MRVIRYTFNANERNIINYKVPVGETYELALRVQQNGEGVVFRNGDIIKVDNVAPTRKDGEWNYFTMRSDTTERITHTVTMQAAGDFVVDVQGVVDVPTRGQGTKTVYYNINSFGIYAGRKVMASLLSKKLTFNMTGLMTEYLYVKKNNVKVYNLSDGVIQKIENNQVVGTVDSFIWQSDYTADITLKFKVNSGDEGTWHYILSQNKLPLTIFTFDVVGEETQNYFNDKNDQYSFSTINFSVSSTNTIDLNSSILVNGIHVNEVISMKYYNPYTCEYETISLTPQILKKVIDAFGESESESEWESESESEWESESESEWESESESESGW